MKIYYIRLTIIYVYSPQQKYPNNQTMVDSQQPWFVAENVVDKYNSVGLFIIDGSQNEQTSISHFIF